MGGQQEAGRWVDSSSQVDKYSMSECIGSVCMHALVSLCKLVLVLYCLLHAKSTARWRSMGSKSKVWLCRHEPVSRTIEMLCMLQMGIRAITMQQPFAAAMVQGVGMLTKRGKPTVFEEGVFCYSVNMTACRSQLEVFFTFRRSVLCRW